MQSLQRRYHLTFEEALLMLDAQPDGYIIDLEPTPNFYVKIDRKANSYRTMVFSGVQWMEKDNDNTHKALCDNLLSHRCKLDHRQWGYARIVDDSQPVDIDDIAHLAQGMLLDARLYHDMATYDIENALLELAYQHEILAMSAENSYVQFLSEIGKDYGPVVFQLVGKKVGELTDSPCF
jgi:hypothetical protein